MSVYFQGLTFYLKIHNRKVHHASLRAEFLTSLLLYVPHCETIYKKLDGETEDLFNLVFF